MDCEFQGKKFRMGYYFEIQLEYIMLLKIKLWMRLFMKFVQINGRLNFRVVFWKIYNYEEQIQKGNFQKRLEVVCKY